VWGEGELTRRSCFTGSGISLPSLRRQRPGWARFGFKHQLCGRLRSRSISRSISASILASSSSISISRLGVIGIAGNQVEALVAHTNWVLRKVAPGFMAAVKELLWPNRDVSASVMIKRSIRCCASATIKASSRRGMSSSFRRCSALQRYCLEPSRARSTSRNDL